MQMIHKEFCFTDKIRKIFLRFPIAAVIIKTKEDLTVSYECKGFLEQTKDQRQQSVRSIKFCANTQEGRYIYEYF